ncbi:MAG: T9SS type A sorting domain-containing protein, partial [Hymenobacteraceae bacterium]|nr:T9SS type A sorting domain-containing protein [Hymenobacteraceae bacterium]MDX5395742.1 T9SS type A sorting domain-containing protein [Hymenobacteraceae bacterium]MDX5511796.1 T9SS type A sorting domain-containing protein [Hymenobacteraceae bacterium]
MLGVNQLHNLSYSLVETDGDSLVYSLQPVLGDNNTPVPYAPGFSAQQPFGSHANPGISIDAATGVVTVQPTTHVVTQAANQEYQNQYVVGLQIDEYRKDSTGTYFKIGHVKNDVFYWVTNAGGTNQPPSMVPVSINGSSYNPGSVVTVASGQPISLELTASDPNPQNQLRFISTHSYVLNGATSTVTGPANNPTFTLNWTPTAADIRDQPYFVSVDVVDNSTPINAVTNHTFAFRVRQVTSVKDKLITNSPLISSVIAPGVQERFTVGEELLGAEVEIRNMQGQLVRKFSNYKNNWSATDVPAGVYLYQVQTSANDQAYLGKLLITK